MGFRSGFAAQKKEVLEVLQGFSPTAGSLRNIGGSSSKAVCLAFRVEFGVSGVFLRGSTAFDGVPERSESCASEAGPYVCGAARLPSMLPARVRFQAVLLIRTSNSFFARPS